LSINDDISNGDTDEKKDNQELQQETVRFRGKEIPIEKLQKRMSQKPKIYGTILINISIILIIIIIILIVFN
jgi:hypothetical protein